MQQVRASREEEGGGRGRGRRESRGGRGGQGAYFMPPHTGHTGAHLMPSMYTGEYLYMPSIHTGEYIMPLTGAYSMPQAQEHVT